MYFLDGHLFLHNLRSLSLLVYYLLLLFNFVVLAFVDVVLIIVISLTLLQ